VRTGWDFGARFSGMSTTEKWGYGFWLFLGLVFAIPETWSGLANPPWPSLTDTVAHLEALASWTALIVVAVIVIVAFYFVRVPVTQTGTMVYTSGGFGRGTGAGVGRTYNGRLSKTPADISPVAALIYIPLALAVIAVGSIIAAVVSGDYWVEGYVIYGLIAIFLVIIPNVLAYWFAREVPWPTLLTTIVNLERRWRPAAVVVLAGLVILLLHLALPPWPDML
jgi:nicotinamide riboside transporter PnuC